LNYLGYRKAFWLGIQPILTLCVVERRLQGLLVITTLLNYLLPGNRLPWAAVIGMAAIPGGIMLIIARRSACFIFPE
jgi:hypothetical protein